MYKFVKEDFLKFNDGDSRCFVLPNGLGGYSSQSVINSMYRKHSGYLVACLKPPVDRKMILGRINESVKLDSEIIDLECQRYEKGLKNACEYIREFSLNYIPTYIYDVKGVLIKKRISPKYDSNTVAISYEIRANRNCSLYLEPLFNYRDHGDASKTEDLKFSETLSKGMITLEPEQNKNIKIRFIYSEGELISNTKKITEGIHDEYDISTGDPRLDHFYKPYKIKVDVKQDEIKKISFVCTIDKLVSPNAFEIIKENELRIESLIKKSRIKDPLGKDLVVSADTFISKRNSTKLKTVLAGLPWFTDWGRDTMISFTGLTLVTRRFEEAKEILKSFSLYERKGLIPNMFPDDGGEPLYNTVDASLWYFYACYKYVKYTKDSEFIHKEIYPVLKNIIKAYSSSSDFSIYMDEDYLVHAGSDQDQVTWMDVRTGGVAVTPRHGKPAEINALWYNALMIMDEFQRMFNETDDTYSSLAKKVKESFNKKFYCEKTGCLYDVVDPDDDKIRPNQCFVLSLPFKVLDEKYEESVFEKITDHLYNTYGLRSLSYKDKDFKPRYEGGLLKRDYAYHMGTTWGFLIGTYLDAYAYINRNSPTVKEEVNELVHRFIPHLNEGCINGIAEVFDGKTAFRTRGCYTQAWSVGELLRAYYENVLSK